MFRFRVFCFWSGLQTSWTKFWNCLPLAPCVAKSLYAITAECLNTFTCQFTKLLSGSKLWHHKAVWAWVPVVWISGYYHLSLPSWLGRYDWLNHSLSIMYNRRQCVFTVLEQVTAPTTGGWERERSPSRHWVWGSQWHQASGWVNPICQSPANEIGWPRTALTVCLYPLPHHPPPKTSSDQGRWSMHRKSKDYP